MDIIRQLEAEQAAKIEAKRKLPEFQPGDTVRVLVRVTEGTRTRVQAYEGVCIARSGAGLNENFTVRKISYGEGVERVFPVFSPLVAHFHWQRASPSLTVKGAVLISELFPGWQGLLHVKDSSGRAFPGDHASVLMLWALFVSAFAGGWRRWLVWSLAALFMLPRVVAGAHWLSDVLVGGTFLALTTIAWGLCTPYAARAAALMDRLATPLALRLGRLPGLRRLAFFSAR